MIDLERLPWRWGHSDTCFRQLLYLKISIPCFPSTRGDCENHKPTIPPKNHPPNSGSPLRRRMGPQQSPTLFSSFSVLFEFFFRSQREPAAGFFAASSGPSGAPLPGRHRWAAGDLLGRPGRGRELRGAPGRDEWLQSVSLLSSNKQRAYTEPRRQSMSFD